MEIMRHKSTELVVGPESKLSEVVSVYMANFLSAHTRSAYTNDFKNFGTFLESIGRKAIHPKDVRKSDVIKYRDHLREVYSPTTANRKLSAISSLFSELQSAQIVSENPCDGVKRPKAVVKRELLGFTDKEINQILDSFKSDDPVSSLNRAVLSFLFYTGCRVSEALSVKLKDLDEVDGFKVVHIRGKGDKLRTLPLNPKLQANLGQLLNLKPIKKDDFLFSSLRLENRKPLSRQWIFKLLKSKLRELNLPQGRSPHSSRRSVVSNLLENGSKLESVAKLAGHSSVNTTLRYLVRKENIEDHPLLTLKFQR